MTARSLMEIYEDKSEYLAEIKPCNHLLESLLAWPWRVSIDSNIVGCSRQDYMLIVESSVLTIDRNQQFGVQLQMCELRN